MYYVQDRSIEYVEEKNAQISKVERTMNLCIPETSFFLF